MNSKLNVSGHAWNRRFFYTEGGSYRELYSPGGAALLAAILGDIALPCTPPEGAMCEHVQLTPAKRAGHYYAGAHLGSTAGSSLANACGDNFPSIIWDEGHSGIQLPEGGQVLWASRVALPDLNLLSCADHDSLMLMLDADVLRRHGAMISRQVSWERSATDAVWQLYNNPAIRHLSAAGHVLITFAEDGAVYVRRTPDGPQPLLMLAHGGAEGALRGRAGGGMPDAWAVMVAGVAAQFGDILSGCAPRLSPVFSAAQLLISAGYDTDMLESGDYTRLLPEHDTGGHSAPAIEVPVYDASLGADPYYWRIGSDMQGRKIFDMALDYVTEGDVAIEGLPRLAIGGLTTVDRREIEAFQNISNLIAEYAAGRASRPLCIAVFGAPGSGKSFGVTQIAKNILPGLVEKLEFNVSQFAGVDDLSAAFHKVRDVVLQGGLPLAFFDEFDSDRDGRALGWLKSFLMPMQDGKFKDDSGEHPIGKCILVFAGGTSPSFNKFCAPMQAPLTPEGVYFKEAKGPDFVSRLRASIDVLGPNPTGDDDLSYILRRALLLRSLGERKLPRRGGRLLIDEHVLKAMLLVPRYKHGARSMEAILDMSRLGGDVWEPASLPFITQLDLHVDADVFIRLVLNETRLESYTEKLARTAHGDYLLKQTARGESGPAMLPWEQLPEHIRQENCRQIRLISKKLRNIGCSYDAGDTPFASVEQFSDEEIMLLARFEHDMWMASRSAVGYVYGPVRCDEPLDSAGGPQQLTHPDMVAWEQLSETAKQKDIDTVKNIIPLLKSAGLRVYRTI